MPFSFLLSILLYEETGFQFFSCFVGLAFQLQGTVALFEGVFFRNLLLLGACLRFQGRLFGKAGRRVRFEVLPNCRPRDQKGYDQAGNCDLNCTLPGRGGLPLFFRSAFRGPPGLTFGLRCGFRLARRLIRGFPRLCFCVGSPLRLYRRLLGSLFCLKLGRRSGFRLTGGLISGFSGLSFRGCPGLGVGGRPFGGFPSFTLGICNAFLIRQRGFPLRIETALVFLN